jgi:hypothetical protein
MELMDLHQASWRDRREAPDCFVEDDTFSSVSIHDLPERCCENELLRHHDADWPDQVIARFPSSGIFVRTVLHRRGSCTLGLGS